MHQISTQLSQLLRHLLHNLPMLTLLAIVISAHTTLPLEDAAANDDNAEGFNSITGNGAYMRHLKKALRGALYSQFAI